MNRVDKYKLNAAYARQRLTRILTDMVRDDMSLNWSNLAAMISEYRGVEFNRENFRRLRKGRLSDGNLEIIISYIEDKHDPDIREKLKPESIFDDLARPARDYYFHIPEENNLDEWNEQILEEFEGIYFCGPAGQELTFMPSSYIRRWMREETGDNKDGGISQGKLNVFFKARSILILRATEYSYFYAAELPLSALMNPVEPAMCPRVYYEGIGIVSSNTIQIKLRCCLTRIPKTHTIAISEKTNYHRSRPHGLSLHILKNPDEIGKMWEKLSDEDVAFLKEEQALSIGSDFYLDGVAADPSAPLPSEKSYISMFLNNRNAYMRKPSDFLHNIDKHFFLSEVTDVENIRKIVETPLTIGSIG